jgi:tripartite-type tricarboxylate transporter receptor subunit TctC
VNDFKEFIAYAKANADKMTIGSPGAGSATHLACVVLDSGAWATKVTARAVSRHRAGDAGPAGRRIDFLCGHHRDRQSRRSTAAP